MAGEVDAAPLEFPLVTAAQRAGEGDRLGSPWAPGAPVDVPALASPPVEQVITARGSQRRMDASRGLSQDLLRTSMAVALRGLDVPHWVVVHDVAGLTPGVYRWPDLDEPVRSGALRDELYRVCLDQALARDAAFVAIAAADLAGLGDAGYRAAHLAAGLAEGRLHLAAYALGASATGMTFLDSEVRPFWAKPSTACCSPVSAFRSTGRRRVARPAPRPQSAGSPRRTEPAEPEADPARRRHRLSPAPARLGAGGCAVIRVREALTSAGSAVMCRAQEADHRDRHPRHPMTEPRVVPAVTGDHRAGGEPAAEHDGRPAGQQRRTPSAQAGPDRADVQHGAGRGQGGDDPGDGDGPDKTVWIVYGVRLQTTDFTIYT